MNVCGLRNKLLLPDFHETVSKCDLFACTETHLDEFDVISLDKYVFFSKYRRQRTLRKSGGIGFFVKSAISKYCNIIESDCEYVQWCQISKTLFKGDEDLVFGIVYIPPDNTKFFKQSIVDKFYTEWRDMCSYNKYVLILGDLNARTATLDDVICRDEIIFDNLNIDSSQLADNDAYLEIQKHPLFNIQRKSQDQNCNRMGRILTEHCKSNNLVILNGRCYNDSLV